MCFFGDITTACALRWGVAYVGVYSIGHWSPRRGTPFQVQGVCRETTLTQGRHYKGSRVVALVLTFVKYIRTNVGHGALKACNLYCFMKTIFYI